MTNETLEFGMDGAAVSSLANASGQEVGWEFKPIDWTWQKITRTILAVLGTLGNTLVIFVYMKQKKASSCTNTLIIGLAVADLITSLHQYPRPEETSVPTGLAGELYCRVMYVGSSVTMWCAIIASVFTLTLIACERYIAVVYATHYRRVFRKNRPKLLLLACWLTSILLNSQSLYICFLDSVNHRCAVAYPSVAYQRFIGVSFFLIEFLLPVIIMLFTQTRTVMTLRMQAKALSRDRKETNGPALSILQARRRVIEMLFAVVITFIVCWGPDQVGYLCFMIGIFPLEFLFSDVYQALVVIAFANCCMNPFIYAARNSNFRRALRELLKLGKNNKIHAIGTVVGQMEETQPDSVPQSGSGRQRISETIQPN